ncbi:DUF1398 domain-containing protein [Flavobacterium cerinum]|uniref:DUF1398 domain-containing protein n=1 Tax=Flavobacterium cerinum TaxID=2502784 RepID=A0ABY5IPU9_9FLAO|nr:DUF1398 family protein [Flavobacterium cerinum]UUC44784.1 DUF1398 domain-containing protein [Flavobacterium cerinum]
MFTIEQIKAAHAKVHSGADFPDYVQDLIQLGVIFYETYVKDGHTEYYGEANYQITSGPVYEPLIIATKTDRIAFLDDLKAHQRGLTNYMAFCNDCARSGIAKWAMDMQKRTCTYYDWAGNEILVENIPN